MLAPVSRRRPSRAGSRRGLASRFLLPVLFLLPQGASAWSHSEHQLIARIAWQRLSPGARAAAISLLQKAPVDSGLPDLYPDYRLKPAELDLIFFERASTWPDLVRGREAYDHPEWHYVNLYWEQPPPPQPPRDRPDLAPVEPNLITQLGELEAVLRDRRRPAGERALALAWVLHLVGDIHQPLHCSSRVTDRRGEQDGDRGGNDFELSGVPHEDLHGLWDFILELARPRRPGERYPGWIERTTREVLKAHPFGREIERRLLPGDYRAWAREGLELAKAECYPPKLRRGSAPPPAIIEAAWEVARERIALAGYRLAELLERLDQ